MPRKDTCLCVYDEVGSATFVPKIFLLRVESNSRLLTPVEYKVFEALRTFVEHIESNSVSANWLHRNTEISTKWLQWICTYVHSTQSAAQRPVQQMSALSTTGSHEHNVNIVNRVSPTAQIHEFEFESCISERVQY